MRDPASDTQRLTAAWDVLMATLGGPASGRDTIAGGNRQPDSRQIPVTVFSGFLGAGKTTLLCRLLEHSPLEIVAIVNDLASANVDASTVRSRGVETIEFQNGCACCLLRDDLSETLEEIASRARPPHAIVVEASGISDPMGIAQTVARAAGTTLDGIVTVIDAQTIASHAADPVTAPLFVRQINASHLVVVTKTDDCSDSTDALVGTIGAMAPGRSVVNAGELFRDHAISADILLGAALKGARPPVAAEHHDPGTFTTQTLEWSGTSSNEDFFDALDSLPGSVYRIKGRIWLDNDQHIAGSGRPFEVQAVGSRWRITEYDGAERTSQLVVIGRSRDDGFEHFVELLRGMAERGIQTPTGSHGRPIVEP